MSFEKAAVKYFNCDDEDVGVEQESENNVPNGIWVTQERIFIRIPKIIDSDFYDDISTLLINLIISKNNTDIVLLIDSMGGSLDPTLDMYNLLQAMNNKIITIAFNNCCSAACALFALGEERYLLGGTRYILHQIRAVVQMEKQMQTTEIKKFANSFENFQNNYKQIIEAKTNIPKSKIKEIFNSLEDTVFSEEEIIKYKVATKIFSKFSDIPL